MSTDACPFFLIDISVLQSYSNQTQSAAYKRFIFLILTMIALCLIFVLNVFLKSACFFNFPLFQFGAVFNTRINKTITSDVEHLNDTGGGLVMLGYGTC